MPEATGAAQLDQLASILGNRLGALADLYDCFNSAADPLSSARNAAENTFLSELARYYDYWPEPKPEFGLFKRAIVVMVKKHLKATRKPSDCELR